jgi:hypothetical protein
LPRNWQRSSGRPQPVLRPAQTPSRPSRLLKK